MLRIESGAAITNNINSKSVEVKELSPQHTNDKITDVSFFGHGYGQAVSGSYWVAYTDEKAKNV